MLNLPAIKNQELEQKLNEVNNTLIECKEIIDRCPNLVVRTTGKLFFHATVKFLNVIISQIPKKEFE